MLKYLLFLFVFGQIEAQYGIPNPRTCAYPRFDNGRFRIRQKSKLIKFVCFPSYELVGNKYATCRDGEWDVPLPVCVKSGCAPLTLDNGVQIPSRSGAWLVFFCLPGYNLVGSSALFCNGRRWNGTAPTCVDSRAPTQLSCDFEESSLCGWSQDELHDFDWKRLNKKTPSSFLFTGPSFDHTYGEEGLGHYMYIESTSRLENDTARLLSPVYDKALVNNGCFEFFYHMFGKTTGGLRVFQKPDNLPMQNLLQLSNEDIQKYILFEKWGNQGDVWLNAVSQLKDFKDNFQIVIEGIRGKSFTSDIAVDDVSILQGERCIAALQATTSTSSTTAISDSCSGRCDVYGTPSRVSATSCVCTVNCVVDGSCCADFFELCIFDSSGSPDDNSPAELPQTQKLVASTVITKNFTTEPTTTLSSTTKRTIVPVTTEKLSTTPINVVTTAKTTKLLPKPSSSLPSSTTKIPKLVFKTTTALYNGTGIIQKDTRKPETTPPSTKMVEKTTKLVEKTTKFVATTKLIATTKFVATTKVTTITPVPFKSSTVGDKIDKMKRAEEKAIQARKYTPDVSKTPQSSSALRAVLLTLTGLLICLVGGAVIVWSRGARGRQAIARLRGRTRCDPEVRYLSADDE